MPYKLREFTQRTRALVLQRAIDIISNQGVHCTHQDTDHASFHVVNQRDGYYHVEVRFKQEDVVFTHCDCPYRGVGICKHTAAALLDLLVKEGFDVSTIKKKEFIYNDSQVTEESDIDDEMKELINELAEDKYFDLFTFLGQQDQQQLLGFIGHYLEESEDIRLVIMAYIWYKSQKESKSPPFLS
jgi:hypothetical protein